jgi:hypothetical protein
VYLWYLKLVTLAVLSNFAPQSIAGLAHASSLLHQHFDSGISVLCTRTSSKTEASMISYIFLE